MPVVYSTTARADFIRFVEHCLFVVSLAILITLIGIIYIPQQEGVKPMRHPEPGEQPICWIVEPATPSTAPYMTQKPEVADKRRKAGDTVTPHYSQKPIEGKAK